MVLVLRGKKGHGLANHHSSATCEQRRMKPAVTACQRSKTHLITTAERCRLISLGTPQRGESHISLLRGNGTISSKFLLLNTRRDNVAIPGLGGSWTERDREERALGLNGMHKIGHRWMGTAETKGTSSSFIVVLGLGEEMVELRLHAHPLYIVLRHVRVRPVAARGAFT